MVAAAQIAGALQNVKLHGFVRWVSVLALIVATVVLFVSYVDVAHDPGSFPSPSTGGP